MANAILQTDTNIPSLSGKTTDQKIDTIMNYLFMLREQLTYTLNNIDSTNFNETGLKEITEPIAIGISEKIEDLDGRVTTNTTNIGITAGKVSVVVDQNDDVRAGVIVSAINGDSEVKIIADRLTLTGSIVWEDLTSSAQQRVDEGKGDANPSYIHSTYISQTTIKSPTIEANVFNVKPLNSSQVTGSYNIYGNFNESLYHFLTIAYNGADTPTITFDSPGGAHCYMDFDNVDFYGHVLFASSGQETHNGIIKLSSNSYGTSLPASGPQNVGRIFFLKD